MAIHRRFGCAAIVTRGAQGAFAVVDGNPHSRVRARPTSSIRSVRAMRSPVRLRPRLIAASLGLARLRWRCRRIARLHGDGRASRAARAFAYLDPFRPGRIQSPSFTTRLTLMTIQTLHLPFACSLPACSPHRCCKPCRARAQDYTDIWWAAGGTESRLGRQLRAEPGHHLRDVLPLRPSPEDADLVRRRNLTRSRRRFFGRPLTRPRDRYRRALESRRHASATLVGTATFTPTRRRRARSSTTSAMASVAKVDRAADAYERSCWAATITAPRSRRTPDARTHPQQRDGLVRLRPAGDADDGRPAADSISSTPAPKLHARRHRRAGRAAVPHSDRDLRLHDRPTPLNTTATIYEVKATSIGLEGRWIAPNVGGGCEEDAQVRDRVALSSAGARRRAPHAFEQAHRRRRGRVERFHAARHRDRHPLRRLRRERRASPAPSLPIAIATRPVEPRGVKARAARGDGATTSPPLAR